MSVILNHPVELPARIRAAVLDFDGTLSTLRCGWEAVMEQVFMGHLAQSGLDQNRLLELVRGYIDESTGIQTIFQMEWLAEQVRTLCGREPLDPWSYKDEYNQALLEMIARRTEKLAEDPERRKEFLVPGSLEFVRRLTESGVDVYIASGTDDEDVHREAERLGVLPWVKAIRGAPRRKKDCSKAAVIEDILKNHGLCGDELLVAGDGKVEIQLGREAGALTIGVASQERKLDGSFHPGKLEKLKKAGADILTPDFVPLLKDWTRYFITEPA